ncbi:MAG: hypothetical protein EXR75_01785 [Myxococcales bacterium]|nr:hypothetical protein [Myxococcales bacterium]
MKAPRNASLRLGMGIRVSASVGAGVGLLAMTLTTACARQADLYDEKDWLKAEAGRPSAWRDVESLFGRPAAKHGEKPATLRGVRHDLFLRKTDKPTARCACLDVGVGAADDPRFRWQAGAPRLAHNELAFAMRTDGSQCSAEAGLPRRPSIHAVDRDGPHVIVVVEELPPERPQAVGAVVERPDPGGSLFVRSRPQKGTPLVYARDGGGAACRVVSRGRDER